MNYPNFATSDASTRPGAAITFYDTDSATYGNGGLRFKTSSGTLTTRMTISQTGNVGIGTTAPSEKLHVVGNLRVQGSTDCTLGNGAGGTNCSSDIRTIQ